MAPERPESKRLRWFLIGSTAVLALLVVVLLIIGAALRSRVTSLEEQQRNETLATTTAEIATCYASARGRPRLIVILRLLANTAERDPVALEAVESFIMDYENSTPTVPECDKRAIEAGFNPKDFPPSNRGEEGNGR